MALSQLQQKLNAEAQDLTNPSPWTAIEAATELLADAAANVGAKVVDVVDRAARLALTASQVNVGDIVREVGEVVENSITVSGAGSFEADGDYVEDGTEQSRTRWRKGDQKIVWAGSGYWMIYDDNLAMPLYVDGNQADVESPLDVTGWVEDSGAFPAPSFAQTGIPAGGAFLVLDTAKLDDDAGWQALQPGPVLQIGDTPYKFLLDSETGKLVIIGDSSASPVFNLHAPVGSAGNVYYWLTNSSTGQTPYASGSIIGIDTDNSFVIYNFETTPIRFGVGGADKVQVLANGNLRVLAPAAPASAGATGSAGEIAWDSNYLYVCVAANTWKRAALSTWP